jgi:outer membrane receptor protein involved in Fe transport
MTRTLFAVLLVVVLFTTNARAQSGTVVGTVVDESGGVVPGAEVVLVGPTSRQTATSGPTGAFRFENVAPGTYQLTVLMASFAPAIRNDVVVTSGELTVPAITLAIGGVGEVVVISAGRTEASLLDAPATMTVLPGSALAALPAQNYGDLLRAVPGMNVIQLSARDVNITARQATTTLATSQLTLLDGRSVYLDFFGLVLWDFVPTNSNDIKQIEVVRGPASAVWGANALTGVVNIITKTPRETAGQTNVTFSGGYFDRDAGSTIGQKGGATFGAGVSTSQVANDRWSYRLSAGYFRSDAYARPTGQIPVIPDPRDPTGRTLVGGARYPADAAGTFGTAFQNSGTSQPKFDVRVDQELTNGHVTYSGGIAGTEGTVYTGTGPFEIQPGSVMSYGRMAYTRKALNFNVFTNIVNADAPNLLLGDPTTGRPIQLNFKTQTFDVELGHASAIGARQALTYGGNYRRNNFDITLTPASQDRNELGAYVQDEIFAGKMRFSIGARVDKFGNIEDPVFSPRLSAMFRPALSQSVRVSFNRAFRSPSTVNNYLEQSLVTPVDLRGLAPFLPPAAQPLVANPFPLVVRAIGSEIPINGVPQEPSLKEESLTAYEVAYTGTINERTTVGLAFYVNDSDDNINFVQLPNNRDPYTASNPPPGWLLPPALLTQMAQLGIFLPRTAFTYFNLGPTRQKGIELSLDQRVSDSLSLYANYSWQDEPTILDDPNPFPAVELSLPPTNRFNLGGTYNDSRFLGSVTVNYSDKAFWSDVLTSPYHGFTDSYTLVNGSFGIKWANGKVTTSIKSNNIMNKTVQQHIFGDLLRRSVIGEVRLDF